MEIEVAQSLVSVNRELIPRFEQKSQAAFARVCRNAPAELQTAVIP